LRRTLSEGALVLRHFVSYRILACDRRCDRQLRGDFHIILDILLCTVLLTTVDLIWSCRSEI